MKHEINLAHYRQKTATGDYVNFAIFDAVAESDSEKDKLELLNGLVKLTIELKKLKIDQAVIAFYKDDELRLYGSNDLIKYLSRSGLPEWTHTLELEGPEIN